MQKQLTVEIAKDCLTYNPSTGDLTWKARNGSSTNNPRYVSSINSRMSGRSFGKKRSDNGYVQGMLLKKHYFAHRLAWFLHYGEWPSGQLDHINGIRHDNRIANLRVVNTTQNMRNSFIYSSNTSGVCGVHWCNTRSHWRASIKVDGRTKTIGYFATKEEAAAARAQANIKYGFTARHGEKV